MEFTVNDATTPAGKLSVFVVTDNPQLLPTTNFQFAPVTSTNATLRQFAYRPTSGLSGVVNVTITVMDEDDCTASTTFKITVPSEPPTISNIPVQVIQKGGSLGPIPFTVSDGETFPDALIVLASSSNKAFLPEENILLGGSGMNRTVTVTNVANAEGASTITITVRDSEGMTNATSFLVTTPIRGQTLALISSITNHTTAMDTPTPAIPFKVGTLGTPTSLAVIASSSNQTLVPDGNVHLSGTGENRVVTITPAKGQTGTTIITITVIATFPDSPGMSASASFALSVLSPALTISSIPDQTSYLGDQQNTILTFAIVGDETDAASLTVVARSSNQILVPDTNIFLGRIGTNRTAYVLRALDQPGTTTITITATSPDGKSASTSFNWTVRFPPLRISRLQWGADGRFQFDVTKPSAVDPAVLEISTNLLDWTPVSTNRTVTNSVRFVDPDAAKYLRHFYRVFVPQ